MHANVVIAYLRGHSHVAKRFGGKNQVRQTGLFAWVGLERVGVRAGRRYNGERVRDQKKFAQSGAFAWCGVAHVGTQ